MPLLLKKEFSSDKENDSSITKSSVDGLSSRACAEMHRARWGPRFDQMDKALSEEEDQLVSAKETVNLFQCKDISGCFNLMKYLCQLCNYQILVSLLELNLIYTNKFQESWLNQVREMQVHCNKGLQLINWSSGIQALGTSETDTR